LHDIPADIDPFWMIKKGFFINKRSGGGGARNFSEHVDPSPRLGGLIISEHIDPFCQLIIRWFYFLE